MNSRLTEEDAAYIIAMRETLHRCPEESFDLPQTVGVIKKALDEMGIAYSEEFGRSSLVADVGGKTGGPVIALRADMDALPVVEKTGLPFASENAGRMHACGHDGHMAMALGALRILKRGEDSLPFRFRVIFQPSEECDVSGGRMMVENGVLEGVDVVLAQHMAPDIDAGYIGVSRRAAASCCCPVDVTFHGHSAHATKPQASRDALAMAIRAYDTIMLRMARGVDPRETFVCSISCLQAGSVHNVVPSTANMKISVRSFSEETMKFATDSIRKICEHAAEEFGGTADVRADISCLTTVNDERMSALLLSSAKKALGDDRAMYIEPRLSSDDFSWYCTQRPAVYFWNGTRNLQLWSEKSLHNNDFMLDESSLPAGVETVLQFAYDYAQQYK